MMRTATTMDPSHDPSGVELSYVLPRAFKRFRAPGAECASTSPRRDARARNEQGDER